MATISREQLAAFRARLGLPADSASDSIWLDRINNQGWSVTEAANRLRQKAAQEQQQQASPAPSSGSTSTGGSTTSSPQPTATSSQPGDANFIGSRDAVRQRIIDIYENRGLSAPSNLEGLVDNALARGDTSYFDVVRDHAERDAAASGGGGTAGGGGTSGGGTGGSGGTSGGGGTSGPTAGQADLSLGDEQDRRIAESGDVALIQERIEAIYANRGQDPPENVGALAAAVANGVETFDAIRQAANQAIVAGIVSDSTGQFNPNPGDEAAIEGGVQAVVARITAIYENRGLDAPQDVGQLAAGILDGTVTFQNIRGRAEYQVQRNSLDAEQREQANVSARAIIDTTLADYGLEELSDFAWEAIQRGDPVSKILLDLRETQPYKDRFPGIVQRREAGLPPIRESEYIEYEERAKALMRGANLPVGFYDENEDIGKLIGTNVSLQQLSQRVQEGYQQVAEAPEEVRRAFSEFFGVNGDSALAAFFLDPERAESFLAEATETAQVGGTALRFGLEVTQERASRIRSTGTSQAGLEQALRQTNRVRSLFNETAGEKVDFTAEREGLDAFLNIGDPFAEERIRSRLEARNAAFQGQAGAGQGQQGLFGLGSNRRA